MSLTGSQIQQLQEALLHIFDELSLKQMVQIRLKENLSAIAGGGNLSEIVFNLIVWAERSGRAEELITGLSVHNPHNPELKAFTKQYFLGRSSHSSVIGSDNSAIAKIEASQVQQVDTQSGAYIAGNVTTRGGDFVGRDKIVQIDRGIHYHLHGEVAEALPTLTYEPETVLIPTGSFIMGYGYGRPEETPQHIVAELPEFRIGKYPVTNRQYVQFIRHSRRVVRPSLLWEGNVPPEGKLNHPITGITWYEALAYCRWLYECTGRNYTLPSEAQWEKAARGTDGQLYPWGNDWDPDRCNHNPDELVPVDAYPAQNEYGCFDMVGNAREWTSTLWGRSSQEPEPQFAYPWANDGRDIQDAPETVRRVYRGGRFTNSVDYRCTTRGGFLPNLPGPKRDRHGFRVVLLPVARFSASR